MTALDDPPPDEAELHGLMRIGELSRRAGVARGTIQHYLREGLLPAPIKTHPNMSYYRPECVERIRVIKELQTRSHLPLGRIKQILDDASHEKSLAGAILRAQAAAAEAVPAVARSTALTPEQAAHEFGLSTELVDDLRRLRLVGVHEQDGREVVTGADLEVLAAISTANEMGLNADNGFTPETLIIYRDALEGLLQEEVRTFMRIVASGGGAVTPELGQAAVQAATLLVVALRKKSVADYLQAAAVQVPDEMRDG